MAGEHIVSIDGGSADELRRLTVAYSVSKTIAEADLLQSLNNSDDEESTGMSNTYGKAMEHYFAEALKTIPGVKVTGSAEAAGEAKKLEGINTLIRNNKITYTPSEVHQLVKNAKNIANRTAVSVNDLLTKALNSGKKQYIATKEHTAPIDAVVSNLKKDAESKITMGIEIKSQYAKEGTADKVKFSDQNVQSLWGLNYAQWLKEKNYWYKGTNPEEIESTQDWVRHTRSTYYGELLKQHGYTNDANAIDVIQRILSKGSMDADAVNKFIVIMRATVSGKNTNAEHEASVVHVSSMLDELRKNPEQLHIKGPEDGRYSLSIFRKKLLILSHYIQDYNVNWKGQQISEPTFKARTYFQNKAANEFDILNGTIAAL